LPKTIAKLDKINDQLLQLMKSKGWGSRFVLLFFLVLCYRVM